MSLASQKVDTLTVRPYPVHRPVEHCRLAIRAEDLEVQDRANSHSHADSEQHNDEVERLLRRPSGLFSS